MARPFSVNRRTFSRPAMPSEFSRKLEHRQSRKTVASKIASVSFHSSYLDKFMLDRIQLKLIVSDECNIISLNLFNRVRYTQPANSFLASTCPHAVRTISSLPSEAHRFAPLGATPFRDSLYTFLASQGLARY